jgi:hypothetical protein
MKRMQRRLAALCGAVLCGGALLVTASGAEVWRSDFDTDGNADAIVTLQNGPSKVQVSGPAGGFLTVVDWDNTESAYVPDKAGRPLGATMGGGDSFSGLYTFTWSALNQTQTHAYELVGFLGAAVPQTRQVAGAILRHWKVGAYYYVATDLAFGSVGNTAFGYLAGSTASLGTNPGANTYQLAIGYEGTTHVLRIGLYDSQAQQIAGITADLDTDVPGLKSAGTPAQEIGALAVTHLGWEDYTGSGGNLATAWQVDWLAYFDTLDGAFNAVGSAPPPRGACCHPDGTCADSQTQSDCTTTGGVWQGAGTTCASASCAYFDPNTEPWEVVYDGVDSAADNVPNYLRWDSAIDDDWNQPNCSFRLNTPTVGFMSVDRVTNPADHGKTGNIWIRDPILSNAAGFTMEVRVLIQPNSNPDSFSMTYLDDAGSFGVHLSPDRIKAGGLAAASSDATVNFNTTDAFHLYRMVKLANSRTVRVYVDNNPTRIVSGSGTADYAVGSSPYLLYPRVLIGDNENNAAYNANYVLDLVRYRRGATAPGQTPPSFPSRQLPPLPPPAHWGEAWTVGYDAIGQPAGSGWIQGGGSCWVQQADGIMELNTLTSPANARMDSPATWPNTAALTLEGRFKVLPDSQPGGFVMLANDQLGSTALALSTDGAQLMHAYMPVGAAGVPMDTTDDFHVYRITRDANGIYWHLYIDNQPTPSVACQHAEGDLLSFSRIWFGDVGFPVPQNGCHVLIDYVRWHQGANAPPPVPDFDGDGDVDLSDFAWFQACFNGPNRSPTASGCDGADMDGDGDVDLADFSIMQACFNGPNRPPASGCR